MNVLTSEKKSFLKFLFLWIGQFLSNLGSALSGFALSVWILEKTGSPTAFAVSLAMASLPGVLFSPFAGSLADRFNRKKIMIMTDSLDALLKLLFIFLILSGNLTIPVIYGLNFLSSSLGVYQSPAFSAVIPQLVEKRDLGRANSLNQLNMAIKSFVAPILGGVLYEAISLSGVFWVDFTTFFFAIGSLLLVAIPQLEHTGEGAFSLASLLEEFKESWDYVIIKKGFLELMVCLMFLNGFANLALTLVGPLVLSNYSPKVYGLVNSGFGVGLIIGALLSSAFPIRKDRVRKAILFLIPSGLALIVMGSSPSKWVIGLGGVLFFLAPPLTNATFGSLIQSKVEPSFQGRVFALIQALASFVTPLASFIAGPLSQDVFNPLLREGGGLADSIIGRVIGIGSTRGTGVLFIICGLLILSMVGILLVNDNIRHFEDNNPDIL